MIRDATEADLPRLLELGREMHAESWYSGLTFSPAKVKAVLRQCMAHGFLRVHERDGVVDGGLVGAFTEVWCAEESQAEIIILYVSRDRRGGMTAYRLVNEFWTWAHARGAREIAAGVTTALEMAGKLYEGMGMTRVGGVYRARIGGESV